MGKQVTVPTGSIGNISQHWNYTLGNTSTVTIKEVKYPFSTTQYSGGSTGSSLRITPHPRQHCVQT